MSSYAVAVIGCGYWGPNLIRNCVAHPKVSRVVVCDKNPKRLEVMRRQFPSVETTESSEAIFQDASISAVLIALPVSLHYPLARAALQRGKHVLLEKPMTSNVAEAEELNALARAAGLTIFVDHTFLYTGAIRYIKKQIDADALGPLLYYDSVRINLGLFQHDVNVIWDLAPHDVSIMLYLMGATPRRARAIGVRHFKQQHENIAHIYCDFAENLIGHIHVNWLSPVKIRKTILAGAKKMIVYDDNEVVEKVKIYDSGIDLTSDPEKIHETLISYRSGDIYVPKIEGTEALKNVISDFLNCVETGAKPVSDGLFGQEVIRVLQAADQSLKSDGSVVEL
ncbi:MAG: Gfo/Idh/MocA family oxidoreductase [Candidatus Sumerlaeota bacterium]|nr:Gfo/Idh/MocA family oxidoreductase [Candidatus Sumerlaeota bacterium]